MKSILDRKTKGAPKATQGDVQCLVYSVPQLCKALNRNRVGIYADLAEGKIPSRKLGNRYIISRAAIDAWLRGSDIQTAV